MKISKLLSVLVSLSFIHTNEGPVWNDRFSMTFTEELNYWIFSNKTTGKFVYDYTNKSYSISRKNGMYDRYCGSVYKLRNTPCTHFVQKGVRYLHFPEKDDCCVCCTDKGGCGILRPDWMKDGKLEREFIKDQIKYEVWNKPGL